MKTLHLDSTELGLDFNASLKLATAIARQQLGDDAMLLSWYDRERDYESPAGVSECHEGCPVKGFWDYALNRDARLAVDFGQGTFVFCFLKCMGHGALDPRYFISGERKINVR